MNIHPIVVHFPIALLTVYSLMECLRFRKVLELPHWFSIKASFVILGALGAAAAYVSGPEGAARSLLGEMHESFAFATLVIFAGIALMYALEWFFPSKYSNVVMRPYIIVPLALAGLVVVTITGGLGGALVYGTTFDPFMAPVFRLLGVY